MRHLLVGRYSSISSIAPPLTFKSTRPTRFRLLAGTRPGIATHSRGRHSKEAGRIAGVTTDTLMEWSNLVKILSHAIRPTCLCKPFSRRFPNAETFVTIGLWQVTRWNIILYDEYTIARLSQICLKIATAIPTSISYQAAQPTSPW
jgi:hypothetical protein